MECKIRQSIESLGLTEHDIKLFINICEEKGLTGKALIRQALRCYQLIERKDGVYEFLSNADSFNNSLNFDIDKRDKRTQKDGWAPGNYENKCFNCSDNFIGDKRAIICADCAYNKTDNMELPVNKTVDQELLELIYDDLKMRVSDEGLVNISGFIWTKLIKRVNKK